MKRILALVWAVAGCTSGPYNVVVRSARHPECDARIAALARSLPFDGEYPVSVVRAKNLDGTTLDAAGRLVVPVETMGRYRYLGEVESVRGETYRSQAYASLLWMPAMHETTPLAIRALCWLQAPLRAATVGVWSILVPTSWPCFALYPDGAELHTQELRRGAFALGANTLVVKNEENEIVRTRRGLISTGAKNVTAYAFVDTWAPSLVVTLDDAAAARVATTAAQCWSMPASVSVIQR